MGARECCMIKGQCKAETKCLSAEKQSSFGELWVSGLKENCFVNATAVAEAQQLLCQRMMIGVV